MHVVGTGASPHGSPSRSQRNCTAGWYPEFGSPGGTSVLRTVLTIAILLLAIIAPVWIPAPAARVLAPRPSATRPDDDD